MEVIPTDKGTLPDKHISPWIFPAVYIVLQGGFAALFTFPLIARFADTGFADILDFFTWNMAITSDTIFPVGFTIALTLAILQRIANNGLKVTWLLAIMTALGTSLVCTVIGFLLFGLFVSLSAYGKGVVSGAELGAVMFLFLPLFSGVIGFLAATLLGLKRSEAGPRPINYRIPLLILFFLCICGLVIAIQKWQQEKSAAERNSWYSSENPEDCVKVDETIRDGCWMQKAQHLKDMSVCDRMFNNETKIRCRDDFYANSTNADDCEKSSQKDNCYYIHAGLLRDSALCNKISPDSFLRGYPFCTQ